MKQASKDAKENNEPEANSASNGAAQKPTPGSVTSNAPSQSIKNL